MKVLITTDWYEPVINGVVTSVLNLARGLRALGHNVKILTLSGTRRSYVQGDVTYMGSVGAGIVYPNARLRAAPTNEYVRRLIEWRPDIVHSQCEFSTFLPAKKVAAACGCPLIHTYHTVYEDMTHYFSPSVRLGRYMAAEFSRHVLSETQAVIAPTEKTARTLASYGIKTPIHTIPSGLDLERFYNGAGDSREAARGSFGLSGKDSVLIYLGRLAKEKNISELIRLFAMQDRPNLRFLLVGDGPYRPTLERQARELGVGNRVIFTGMVDPREVSKYYQLGDVFVNASLSETQGLTYIEAMASGLPVLCRADPCLDNVVQNNINGFTYISADDFAEKLNILLSDDLLRSRLSKAARDTTFENYSMEHFAARVAEVYREQLGQKAPATYTSNDKLSAT